ncbi:MAG: hypothetical protein IPO51_14255 [Dehalococcoidia bacterium]|nr:hypothetical protein [Dehalococcoidia bacterium]
MGVDYTELGDGGATGPDVEFVAAQHRGSDHFRDRRLTISHEAGVDDSTSGRIVAISLEVRQTRQRRSTRLFVWYI